MNDTCVIFDLDDTLYKEIDFLKSGYRYIAGHLHLGIEHGEALYNAMYEAYRNGQDAFELAQKASWHNVDKSVLLTWYRYHYPSIGLSEDVGKTLAGLADAGVRLGIISDGRSVTQRNKIAALGLDKYIARDAVVVSEEFGSTKPNVNNYLYFQELFADANRFVYVADNPSKDFVVPNKLGWLTIGVRDNGENIHKQRPVDKSYEPRLWIESLSEVADCLEVMDF